MICPIVVASNSARPAWKNGHGIVNTKAVVKQSVLNLVIGKSTTEDAGSLSNACTSAPLYVMKV